MPFIDILPASLAAGPPAARSRSTSVAGGVALRAEARPDRLAVTDGSKSLSYEQLNARSNRLAAFLSSTGIGPESCVGLYFDRSTEFVASALAVLKAGAAYLPMDSNTPRDRAAFILADSGAHVLLTHRGKARDWGRGPWRVVETDGADAPRIAAQPAANPVDETGPENLAYIIYTSGSTGRPKGVEITHANLANLVEWHRSAFRVNDADRASQVAGLGFDAAVWEIWPHLTSGASLHIADESTRRSPRTLRDWILSEHITISFIPTVMAEAMLTSDWPESTDLRVMLTGADALHRRPASGLPFALVNNYGPTECTVVATSGTVAPDADGGPPSIGKAIVNTKVLILDDALKPVAHGHVGELCIGGASVGRGYRNNPELTASRFVSSSPASGPSVRIYRTGDLARWRDDGEIAFLGRLDDQVKVRGYRIELGEIVASLDLYPSIEASAVALRGEGDGDPALVAYVVPTPETRLTATELRAFLSDRLPDYMIPAQFVALESLPVTNNGKLDKTALPPPSADNLLTTEGADAANPPGSDIERRIAEIVSNLLGLPSVSPEENFFMVGGHSMFGVQLVARIRDTFGAKLTLRQLFNAPTAVALAAEVSRLTGSSGPEAV